VARLELLTRHASVPAVRVSISNALETARNLCDTWWGCAMRVHALVPFKALSPSSHITSVGLLSCTMMRVADRACYTERLGCTRPQLHGIDNNCRSTCGGRLAHLSPSTSSRAHPPSFFRSRPSKPLSCLDLPSSARTALLLPSGAGRVAQGAQGSEELIRE
jgi:hypothetical protein